MEIMFVLVKEKVYGMYATMREKITTVAHSAHSERVPPKQSSYQSIQS